MEVGKGRRDEIGYISLHESTSWDRPGKASDLGACMYAVVAVTSGGSDLIQAWPWPARASYSLSLPYYGQPLIRVTVNKQ